MSATPKDQVLRPNIALQLSKIPFYLTLAVPLIVYLFGQHILELPQEALRFAIAWYLLTAAALFNLFHYYMMRRWSRSVEEYILQVNEGHMPGGEVLHKAYEEVFKIPQRSALIALVTLSFGLPFIIYFSLRNHVHLLSPYGDSTVWIMIAVLSASAAIGTMGIYYAVAKIILRPVAESLIRVIGYRSSDIIFKLKWKVFAQACALVLLPLFIAFSLSVYFSRKAQPEIDRERFLIAARLAASALKEQSDEGDLSRLVSAFSHGDERMSLYISLARLKDDNLEIISGLPIYQNKREILKRLESSDAPFYLEDISPAKSVDWRHIYVQPLGGGLAAVIRAPFNIDDPRQASMRGLFFWVALFTGFYGVFSAWIFSREMMVAMDKVRTFSRNVADHDLTRGVEIYSDDDFNYIGMGLTAMHESLHEFVLQFRQTSESLRETAGAARDYTANLAEGAVEQNRISDEGRKYVSTVAEMMTGLRKEAERLNEASETTGRASGQMSDKVGHVASRTTELSSLLTDMTRSLGQLSDKLSAVARRAEHLTEKGEGAKALLGDMDRSIRSVDELAAAAAKLSDTVASDAERGAGYVEENTSSIKEIEQASKTVLGAVEDLSGRLEQITKIVDIINGIAEKTNLLALNASIISSQAGEHGKGFGVVAQAIKGLAEGTARHTQEISELVAEIRNQSRSTLQSVQNQERQISAGGDLTRQTGQALAQILKSARDSNVRIARIADAAREQAASSAGVLQAFDDVRQMIVDIQGLTATQEDEVDKVYNAASRIEEIGVEVEKAAQDQEREVAFIEKSVRGVRDTALFITSSHREQEDRSVHMAELVRNIGAIAEKNVQGVEAITALLDDLFFVAQSLSEMVSGFKLPEDA